MDDTRDITSERYWMKYDASRNKISVVIPPHIWQIVQQYIDNDSTHQTDEKNNTVFDFELIPTDANDISTRLDKLLIALSLGELAEPPSGNKQLLIIFSLGTEGGYGSCGFDVATSFPFRRWIAGQDESIAQDSREVITSVFYYLHPEITRDITEMIIGASISADFFHLVTFGNCACLGYDGSDIGRLYDDQLIYLVSHNIDNIAQQLSLLAALAYLWGRAHEDLYGK